MLARKKQRALTITVQPAVDDGDVLTLTSADCKHGCTHQRCLEALDHQRDSGVSSKGGGVIGRHRHQENRSERIVPDEAVDRCTDYGVVEHPCTVPIPPDQPLTMH